jgi:hypothetical protein
MPPFPLAHFATSFRALPEPHPGRPRDLRAFARAFADADGFKDRWKSGDGGGDLTAAALRALPQSRGDKAPDSLGPVRARLGLGGYPCVEGVEHSAFHTGADFLAINARARIATERFEMASQNSFLIPTSQKVAKRRVFERCSLSAPTPVVIRMAR